MLKINVGSLTEWLWRTSIKITPCPINKLIEKWFWSRGETWFQKTQQEDPAFRIMTLTIFKPSEEKIAEAVAMGDTAAANNLKAEAECIQEEINYLTTKIEEANRTTSREQVNKNKKCREEYLKKLKTILSESPFRSPVNPVAMQ